MFGRKRLLKAAFRRRFVVTLVDEATFDGLLIDADADLVILADVRLVQGERTAPQPVDGRVYLERSRIAYMQAPRG